MYQLVSGNLELAGVKFIEPGNGLVSGITEEQMVQAGKHPGKTNFTDLDNALNILKFLADRPAAAIMKHNNPCGVAYGGQPPRPTNGRTVRTVSRPSEDVSRSTGPWTGRPRSW